MVQVKLDGWPHPRLPVSGLRQPCQYRKRVKPSWPTRSRGFKRLKPSNRSEATPLTISNLTLRENHET